MKILFITSTRLGDGVLSTAALNYFLQRFPKAQVTVACGPLVAEIFAQAPRVVRVISMKKERHSLHWYRLLRATIGTNWDIVIDLRNSIVSRILLCKKRYVWSQQDHRRHKVEQIAAVIKAPSPPPAPKFWFNNDTLAKASALIPPGNPVLAIGPAANWLPKTWPAENFIELALKLTAEDSILPQARIAVFAAKGEEETAYKVLNALPPERRIDVIAKDTPVVIAAALQYCSLYIGNDSGLMHCAAAAGVPTLGLFGPSWPQHYRPWGNKCAYVSTPQTFDQLINYPGYNPDTAPSLMTSLTVPMAYTAAVDLWKRID